MNDWYFWLIACLVAPPLGLLLWKLLGKTRLNKTPRVLLTALGAGTGALLLVWGWLCLSILIFTWNDPVTW